MDKLLEILREIRSDVDFEHMDDLIDARVLDSFEVVAIVGEINEAFGVEVPVEEIKNENFNSAAAMLKMIERLKEA